MAFSEQRDASGVVVTKVDGQLVVANRQELKQLLQDGLDRGDRRFVLDFSSAAYIDSSGLGALVSVNRKVREAGGDLRLAGLNEDLTALFELTKLDTLFTIAATPAEALAGF